MVKAKKSQEEVTIDRRRAGAKEERKEKSGRRTKAEAVPVEARPIERRAKVNRRRQIDPTTCERDYTEAEVEFMHALDAYKRTSGRMFPTCSEVLEVIRNLGYVKQSPATDVTIDVAAPAENETMTAEALS